MQEHLYKHFESDRHLDSSDDVCVILIDNTDGCNPTKRERYWMQTVKAIAPYDLNVESCQGCLAAKELSLSWASPGFLFCQAFTARNRT